MSTIPSPRRRDAAATRHDLLEAARALFGANGYDNTTLREIGERAGVDASLIARYFGNKAAIYLAAVSAEQTDISAPTLGETIENLAVMLVERADTRGIGPVSQALLQPGIDDEIRAAAESRIRRRLVQPLMQRMDLSTDQQPELRVEIAIAALLGLTAIRSHGSLAGIAAASPGELSTLAADLALRFLALPDQKPTSISPETPATVAAPSSNISTKGCRARS
jgi:AcrR family transcriptional regulator